MAAQAIKTAANRIAKIIHPIKEHQKNNVNQNIQKSEIIAKIQHHQTNMIRQMYQHRKVCISAFHFNQIFEKNIFFFFP